MNRPRKGPIIRIFPFFFDQNSHDNENMTQLELYILGGILMKIRLLSAALLASVLTACATAPSPVDNRNSALTQGNVQMNLKVGQTSKTEVLEVFGAPNITTRDASGSEVWSYQRHATVSQSNSSSSYWTVLLLGGGSSASGFSETSRTMTMIIKFDSNDVVSDFRTRSSDF